MAIQPSTQTKKHLNDEVSLVNPSLDNRLALWHNQINQEMNYTVYSPQGQILFETSSKSCPHVELELPPNMASGSYFLKVSSQSSSKTFTLIK